MAAILLIPILVSGIIWISGHPSESLSISKYQGWLVYLHTIKAGVFITFFSFFLFEFFVIFPTILNFGIKEGHHLPIYSIINSLASVSIRSVEQLFSPDSATNRALHYSISFSIVTIILSYVLVFFERKYGGYKKDVIIMNLYYENSQSDYLLSCIADEFISSHHLKLEDRKLAFITLDTRKFYIGIPVIISPPNEIGISSDEIAILPIYSGFRQEKDLRMQLKNSYKILLPESHHPDDIDHCDLITIPKSRIVTVSAFTMSIHEDVDDNYNKKANLPIIYSDNISMSSAYASTLKISSNRFRKSPIRKFRRL